MALACIAGLLSRTVDRKKVGDLQMRVLGRTELQVSQVGLGGGFLRSALGGPQPVQAIINRAVQLGINYIDTAAGYGDSEAMIGQAIANLDVSMIISTKLGGRPHPFDAQDRDALLWSVEESLSLLGRDHLDILMIHEADRPGQYDWWTDWDSFTGPVVEVLDQLKAEGIISFIGLGGTTAYELAHLVDTGRFDVVLTAFNYSLLWREAEISILPTAKAHDVAVVIGSPLQQGALAQRYDDQVNHGGRWLSPPRRRQFQALYALLDDLEMPLPELGLRFVISNPDISCVLTGALTPEQVDANVAAIERGPLPADVLSRLDEIAAMVPFRPFEEPFGLPFQGGYLGPGPAGGRGKWA